MNLPRVNEGRRQVCGQSGVVESVASEVAWLNRGLFRHQILQIEPIHLFIHSFIRFNLGSKKAHETIDKKQ